MQESRLSRPAAWSSAHTVIYIHIDAWEKLARPFLPGIDAGADAAAYLRCPLLFSNRQGFLLVPPAASSPAINTKNSRGQPAPRPRFIAYEFSDLSIAQRASRNRTHSHLPSPFTLSRLCPCRLNATYFPEQTPWIIGVRHAASRVLLRRYRKRMYHRNRPRFFVVKGIFTFGICLDVRSRGQKNREICTNSTFTDAFSELKFANLES